MQKPYVKQLHDHQCVLSSQVTKAQQTMRALHRVRESLIRDKVKTTNQIHGFLLEFGISLPTGDV